MHTKQVALTAKDGHKVFGTHRQATSPRAAILLVHGITADRHEWGYYDLVGDSLQKPRHPGGWSHSRENPGCGAVAGWGLGCVVVLGLPGLAGCGMMARAARDAGASLGEEPVQKPGAGTLTRRVASCCLEHAGQTSRVYALTPGPRAAR